MIYYKLKILIELVKARFEQIFENLSDSVSFSGVYSYYIKLPKIRFFCRGI